MKHLSFCLLLLVMAVSFVNAPRTITGIVSDDKGNPLAYVAITVKGTSTAIVTGIDGSFSIRVNDDAAILIVTSVGFATQEIKVNKKTRFAITMSPVQDVLHEVVVAGYATKQKRDVMGSVSVLPSQSAGIMPQLMGRAPGVQVTRGRAPREFRKQHDTYNREGYDYIPENSFQAVSNDPLSTFSIDVDAASYSNVRRILKNGQLPEQGAVRIEEMINYFTYQYAQPAGNDPFAVHMELGVCPWNTKHQLALIGLQGKKIDIAQLPPSNLTFLIDVSGSMLSQDKLPLVRESLKLLVDQLREQDKVSIVVYAGRAGLVLPPTSGDHKMRIKEAINELEAGGSTAGGEGIRLAYRTARENFVKEGNNRVVLCTNGDFNVGVSSDDALERLIEEERKSGVFLTVLGYGTGNYQDAKMQKLADKGNGNHAYIDQLSEARKVLINEFGGTLFTIAKDVKLQLEFNPALVKGYRLIGYENRMLAKEDFNNDAKDAGDMGSGHTVTALYEIVPVGEEMPDSTSVDPLRYQAKLSGIPVDQSIFDNEILTLKLRYKQPDSDKSRLLSVSLKNKPKKTEQLSDNFRFASAVASFGMVLRESKYKGKSSYASVLSLAEKAMGNDAEGYRKEFLQLVSKASSLSKSKDVALVEE